MAKIQPTLTITIDDQSFEVAAMSPEVQQMVQFLDDWRQDEADQVSQLVKTRGALRDIQNSMVAQIEKEKQAVAAKEAAETEAASE